METLGTRHQTLNEFVEAILTAAPGSSFVYATGDIACSAKYGGELHCLRDRARSESLAGKGLLTQRRLPGARFVRGGACFEYIFTVRSQLPK